ncbi:MULTISPECIES: hypothetical protein [Bacillus cereus group]|uniref:DUF1642 domain-containing protein n=1 Tax=Bacillus thuringiensis TaxID=1428 RepID=A0AB36V3V2_BACTU|nr:MULTISPECIES: hypothetical protein [Bacillus cereus group]PFF63363.1 hypothetical protein CN334_19410 [Bacillus thuringiensis]PGU49727.1 hypothetical protein COD72_28695 [Bacillus cereus]PGW52241.1 hypothetical protein COE14_22725 [Bacillus thuringiensis]PGZ00036.1 hypothetical protein COE48_27100 [Bacillus thuringiensis]
MTKLEILNKLAEKIENYDADNEILYFAYVPRTESNLELFLELVDNGNEFEDALDTPKRIDLVPVCWKYSNWFNGEHFLYKN